MQQTQCLTLENYGNPVIEVNRLFDGWLERWWVSTVYGGSLIIEYLTEALRLARCPDGNMLYVPEDTLFVAHDGKPYGRIIIGEPLMICLVDGTELWRDVVTERTITHLPYPYSQSV